MNDPLADDPTKSEIRSHVWDALSEEGAARFPFPPHGRIPNFDGAKEAARRLVKSEWFDGIDVVKVNPDAPQRYVRIAALERGIRVLVPTPRLRGGFYLLDPSQIDDEAIEKAASLSHMDAWATTVELDDLPQIDLIVTGCVAVASDGGRCGKGEGYSDLEYAILGALGQSAIPIVTTVHPLQVVPEIPAEAHDMTLSAYALPEKIVATEISPQPPAPLDWEQIDADDRQEMPVLQELWERA